MTAPGRKFAVILPAAAALLVVVAVGAWLVRKPLLDRVARNYLAAHGVKGRYRVDTFDSQHVDISNVSVGAASAPALSAQRIRIDLDWAGLSPRPTNIRLTHPVLQAQAGPNGLSFGTLDALIPKSSGHVTLPDMNVDINDGRVVLSTPYGPLSAHVDGHGLLSDGFSGRLTIAPTTLAQHEVSIKDLSALITVKTHHQQLDGSAHVTTAAAQIFAGCHAAMVSADATVAAPANLELFTATVNAGLSSINCGGARADYTVLNLTEQPDSEKSRSGAMRLTATGVTSAYASAGALACTGSYNLSLEAHGRSVASCRAHGSSVAMARPLVQPLAALSATLQHSALQAVADRQLASLMRASQRMTLDSALGADWQDGRGTVSMNHLQAQGQNGVNLIADDKVLALLTLPDRRIDVAGSVTLSGPALPTVTVDLSPIHIQPGSPLRAKGKLTTSSVDVGALTVGASVIAFDYADQLKLRGKTSIKGALGGIEIDDALVPLDFDIGLKNGLTLQPPGGCVPIRLGGVRGPGLLVGPVSTRLCATRGQNLFRRADNGQLSGGGHVENLTLAVSAGGSALPVRLSIGGLSLGLAGTQAHPHVSLAARGLQGQSGPQAVKLAFLNGAAGRAGDHWQAGGGFGGGAAAAPAFATLASDFGGTWSWSARDGMSVAKSHILVTDSTPRPRFNAIRLTDLSGNMHDGTVDVTGLLELAVKHAALAKLRLTHTVASSSGHLTVDTFGLQFGPALQPYEISELLRGIVENVSGGLDAKAPLS